MRTLSLFILLLTPFIAKSQIDYEKRANEYYKVYSYERALKDYTKVLSKKPNDTDIIEKMIQCYFYSNTNRADAMPLIEKLEKLNPEHKQIQLFYAKAAFHGNQFDDAFKHITQYKSESKLSTQELSEVDDLTNYILVAQSLIRNPLNLTFINLGASVNTDRNEVNPYVSNDEKVLFYTSDKRFLTSMSINYYNVCLSFWKDSVWSEQKFIGSNVNSIYDQITAGLSSNGKELYVFHNKYGDQTLATAAYLGESKFGILTDFEAPIATTANEFGACNTVSGDTLYFAAEMVDGKTDILYSIKLPDGTWGTPRGVPGLINTNADENFPSISADGNKMIFSCNGKKSMGGYDLFYSLKDPITGDWGDPVNMGYPLNDTYDNHNISMLANSRYGYVSALRSDSKGLRDIYKVVFNEEDKPLTICNYQVVDANLSPYIASKPDITLWNELQTEKLGSYSCSPETGRFIVALSPGNFVLEVKINDQVAYQEKISILEKMLPEKTSNKTIVIK